MTIDGTRLATELKAREAVLGPAPGYSAFRRDPKGTVAIWHKMTIDDAKAGKRLSEYRVTRVFDSMTIKQKKECMRYMLENYKLCLDIPPGKIALASAKDNLEGYLDLPFDYVITDMTNPALDTDKLLVLAYSITREKRNTPRTDITKGVSGEKEMDKTLDNLFLAVSASYGDSIAKKLAKKDETDYVPLINNGKTLIVSEAQLPYGDFSQVRDMLDIVALMNSFIKSSPVNDVILTRERSSYFDHETDGIFGITPKRLRISVKGNDLRYPAAHEMGHAVFDVMLYQKLTDHCSNDPDWRNIFRMAKSSAFEIVDDSNYAFGVKDSYGHPFDNESELFASGVAAFVLSPEKLVTFINDPDTPENMKAVGKLVYCYLRDKVFNGIFARDRDGKVVFFTKGTPEYQKNNLINENWGDVRILIKVTGEKKENVPGKSL